MMKGKSGFTLLEMLIVLAILGFVIAASTNTFVTLLRNYKQQGKIAENNIEGIIGLELLRRDIENAGFGLPWAIPPGMTYSEEPSSSPTLTYDDAPNQPPRSILNAPGQGWIDSHSGLSNSDYLIIKATNVARNSSAQLWTYMTSSGPKNWDPVSEDVKATDYVVVLSPGSGSGDMRTLVSGTLQLEDVPWPSGTDLLQPKLVFGLWDGISLSSAPRMPFNRADYYILPPGNSYQPSRCAPNTGELVKATISQKDGSKSDILPLLDCVADMVVVFQLDPTSTGTLLSFNVLNDTNGTPLTARQIRTQVKAVRVYILAQEGQKDQSYTGPASIYVGDMTVGGGHTYKFGTNLNYRWRLYSIVVQPKNMKQSASDGG